METKKQLVRIRQKDIANGNKSLFLDITWDGKRVKEYLKLHLIKPKTAMDRAANKQTMLAAETIRAARHTELQNSKFGLQSKITGKTNFVEYYKNFVEAQNSSLGNYQTWKGSLSHLMNFCSPETTFQDVDKDFCEKYKTYLQNCNHSDGSTKLAVNSQNIYFAKFKTALIQAVEKDIIQFSPAQTVRGIKKEETHREFLTIDEVKKLVKTPCNPEKVKTPFLFSCLTGLRISDILKLQWSEIKQDGDRWYIDYTQEKTDNVEILDISNEARSLLGQQGNPGDLIFPGIKNTSRFGDQIKRWCNEAGIQKTISFHCTRHTFAFLQLQNKTDIFTLSKLLGHKKIETTMIYSKLSDENKRIAMNCLPSIM